MSTMGEIIGFCVISFCLGALIPSIIFAYKFKKLSNQVKKIIEDLRDLGYKEEGK
jgi:hypothetical protein